MIQIDENKLKIAQHMLYQNVGKSKHVKHIL
jgi:hypothetical protein